MQSTLTFRGLPETDEYFGDPYSDAKDVLGYVDAASPRLYESKTVKI